MHVPIVVRYLIKNLDFFSKSKIFVSLMIYGTGVVILVGGAPLVLGYDPFHGIFRNTPAVTIGMFSRVEHLVKLTVLFTTFKFESE